MTIEYDPPLTTFMDSLIATIARVTVQYTAPISERVKRVEQTIGGHREEFVTLHPRLLAAEANAVKAVEDATKLHNRLVELDIENCKASRVLGGRIEVLEKQVKVADAPVKPRMVAGLAFPILQAARELIEAVESVEALRRRGDDLTDLTPALNDALTAATKLRGLLP